LSCRPYRNKKTWVITKSSFYFTRSSLPKLLRPQAHKIIFVYLRAA